MAVVPRLNSVIRALEQGVTPIATFASPPTVEGAIALSTASYDGVIFESEHNAYDIKAAGERLPRSRICRRFSMYCRQSRYPRPKSAPAYEPEGQRGDAPATAAR
jgi:hypothetical protein